MDLTNYKPKTSKANSERALVIEEFVKELEKERPVNVKLMAIKIAHVPTKDLYSFLSMCKDYKNRHGSFGKCFFGALKIK